MILGRKLIFILISQGFSTVSSNIQALASFSILLIFLCLQKVKNPFIIKQLNNNEFFSIFVATATLYAGLYYVTKEITDYGKMALFAFILLANAYFLVHFITQILMETYGILLKKTRYLEYLYGKLDYDNNKEKVWQADIVKMNTKISIIYDEEIDDDLYVASIKNRKNT